MSKKLIIDQVEEAFEREGYGLLSSVYVRSSAKLDYVCPQGHKDSMRWDCFKQGRRCPQCSNRKKLTLEQITQKFEEEGYKVLSKKYLNTHSKLQYECPQGHRGAIAWADFQTGYRCAQCARNVKLEIEVIYQYFKQEKYTLLTEEYENSKSELEYLCPSLHRGTTNWNRFQQGQRCPKCVSISRNERRLGAILEKLFPEHIIQYQDNLGFLGKQTVDYSIRELALAFEYDGEHHFQPTRYGGMSLQKAREKFAQQQRRDKKKDRLCQQHGIKLVRFRYDEMLSRDTVKSKVKE